MENPLLTSLKEKVDKVEFMITSMNDLFAEMKTLSVEIGKTELSEDEQAFTNELRTWFIGVADGDLQDVANDALKISDQLAQD